MCVFTFVLMYVAMCAQVPTETREGNISLGISVPGHCNIMRHLTWMLGTELKYSAKSIHLPSFLQYVFSDLKKYRVKTGLR